MQNIRWISQRADSLAYVFLTRDPRVKVLSLHESAGLDFVIGVGTTPKQASWTSGVEVRGVDGKPPRQYCLNLTKQQTALARNATSPIFLLVVDVRNERFYFAWINSPVNGLPGDDLGSVRIGELDDDQLKLRIDEIRHFYQKPKAEKRTLAWIAG